MIVYLTNSHVTFLSLNKKVTKELSLRGLFTKPLNYGVIATGNRLLRSAARRTTLLRIPSETG